MELDRIYEFKARGAFIRSRKKWLEEGEKSTKYLFNMEKRNVECTSMVKLNINGKLTETVKEISRYVADFYENLYSDDNKLSNAQ